jgi:hypothetical protein
MNELQWETYVCIATAAKGLMAPGWSFGLNMYKILIK